MGRQALADDRQERAGRSTGAHIAIIGHITKDELLRFVSGTELANGFVNRFLLVAVRRSQELPFGGRLDGKQLKCVRDTTLAALRFASPPASSPSTQTPGSTGSRSTARYPAARKACSAPPPAAPKRTSSARRDLRHPRHQRANPSGTPRSGARRLALSLDSARWIFGDTLGDPTADEIWALPRTAPTASPPAKPQPLQPQRKPARWTHHDRPQKPEASPAPEATAAADPPRSGSHTLFDLTGAPLRSFGRTRLPRPARRPGRHRHRHVNDNDPQRWLDVDSLG